MLFTWSHKAPLHYVFTLQVHRRRTVRPEQKSPPASTLVIIRPRAFFKSVLFLFRFVELLPCLTSAWSFSLDSWPIAFQKRPYMRSIRRRVNPELKGDGKGKLKDVSGSFFAYVFFFFSSSSEWSLCLTVLPMLIVCELCLCYVCVWGHLLFFFLIIWRYGVAGHWSKIKTNLFMTCVFNSSLGRHTSLLKVAQTEIY